MKKCQRCNSGRLLNVRARSKDMNTYEMVNDENALPLYSGYDLGLFGEGGDYEEYTVCLECGQMQGEFPLDLKAFLESGE